MCRRGIAKAVVREHRIHFEIKSDLSNALTRKTIDEADLQAKTNSTRYTHEEVFSSIRNQIKAR